MNIQYNSFKYGRCSGAFSLIELIIVIAIVGILFGLSIPSLHLLFQRSHLMMTQSRLFHALAYAKAEAIRLDETVVLCGSQDATQCDGAWQGYWLVQTLSTHKLLRVFTPSNQRLSIKWRGNFRKREGIYFNALGETLGQQGRFRLTAGEAHAALILISSGRVRYL